MNIILRIARVFDPFIVWARITALNLKQVSPPMTAYNRRNFLADLSCTLAGLSAIPLTPLHHQSMESTTNVPTKGEDLPCWLEVVAPFIVEDADGGLNCEIVLTSDTFAGINGHSDGKDSTDYEFLLFDSSGKPIGDGGVAKRMTIPAMRTTVIPIRELIGDARKFFGGLKIRLRSRAREKMQASDLFSSAFVRWKASASFDNIHANPDPPQWQNAEAYYYSMPFPPLDEHQCVFSLFNPNSETSAGEIKAFDSLGKAISTQPYELKPRASLLFDLNAGRLVSDPWEQALPAKTGNQHGLLTVSNKQGTTKSFGYLMIRQNRLGRFSVEHPIHQNIFKPKPAAAPFDNGQFKAKNVLYSPLLFRAKKIGGLTFDSRFYFGAGLPVEESLWLYPFAVDAKGQAVWSAFEDKKLASTLPSQTERGLIRLAANQGCALDFDRLSLDARISSDFSGGLAVAVSPDTNHTLFKVKVNVREWGAYAFTHFRPGLRSARWYQKAKPRGGLATDYIVSGARIAKNKKTVQLDELIGVMNIDDQGLEAHPVLELYGNDGFITRIQLGTIPPFACCHFLLSELIAKEIKVETITLRLVDEAATLLMSTLHLDYELRDIALDHGSDRFSTFLDFVCQ